MNDLEFNALELKVENLLQSLQRLKQENNLLRQKLAKLTQERADLLDKNQRASTRVKRLISQLRNEVL